MNKQFILFATLEISATIQYLDRFFSLNGSLKYFFCFSWFRVLYGWCLSFARHQILTSSLSTVVPLHFSSRRSLLSCFFGPKWSTKITTNHIPFYQNSAFYSSLRMSLFGCCKLLAFVSFFQKVLPSPRPIPSMWWMCSSMPSFLSPFPSDFWFMDLNLHAASYTSLTDWLLHWMVRPWRWYCALCSLRHVSFWEDLCTRTGS